MTQTDFVKIKVGDRILTIYKGCVVEMSIISIFDAGHSKKSVNLAVPNSNKIILRHMYAVYGCEVKQNGSK